MTRTNMESKWKLFAVKFLLLFGMLCLSYSIMCAFPQMKLFINAPLQGNPEWIKTFFVTLFGIFCGLGIYIPMMALAKLEGYEDIKGYVLVICMGFFTLVLMYFGYRGNVLSSHFLTNILTLVSFLGYHYEKGTHFGAFDDLAKMMDYQNRKQHLENEILNDNPSGQRKQKWNQKSTY